MFKKLEGGTHCVRLFFLLILIALAGCLEVPPQLPPGQKAPPLLPPGQNITPSNVSAPGLNATEGEGGTPSGPSPLAGLGFAQLTALAKPVHCAVRITEDGQLIVVQAWLRGNELRVEMLPPDMNETVVTVEKEGVAYLSLTRELKEALKAGEECNWLAFTEQQVKEERGVSVGKKKVKPVGSKRLEPIPPNGFSCNIGTFGGEKFLTPGRICKYEVVLCKAACALLPEEERASCVSACEGVAP